MKETGGQVKLSKLIFTHNWEDPMMDEKVLQIGNGDVVFAITSGGCNALGFLRFSPAAIYCVDINPAQTYLMELKQAAFRRLNYDDFISFMGIRRTSKRMKIFDELKNDLSEEAKIFWLSKKKIISKGLFMTGRYEKFVKIAGWLFRTIQGPNKTKRIFTLNNAEDQNKFYNEKWNNRRWKFIFKTMFNKKRLAKKGLNADYFHFDDGSTSFSESFQKRAAHALTDLPIEDNYFLSLYLLGKYQDEINMPEYLKEQNFDIIKKNIDRLQLVTADSKYWLEQQSDNFFDAFALSNICELMDDTDTMKLFSEVIRTAKPGARAIFRNLMIPREVPDVLKDKIRKDEALSSWVQNHDRSFVYGKVAAYSLAK